jgi:enoyl-CoA hydratase
MSEAIGYEIRDGIAEIHLDDGKVNAMTLGFFEALGRALDRAEQDNAGGLVIVGRPGVFSAGLDVKLLPGLPPPDLKRTLVTFARTLLRVFTLPIPTVAAVSGHAVAGGAILAFACDLRIAAAGPFRLQLNETAIGLTLPSWAIAISESAVPRRHHAEAMLHARPYTPDEALACGMVHALAPPEALLAEARRAAAPLTTLGRAGYAATKQRLRARAVAWASELVDAEMTALPVRPPR